MFLRAKDVTKDIDLIVKSEQDYNTLTTTLMNLGFESTRPTPGMERANISDTLVRDDVRIDLFEKTVCGCLQLSKNMEIRSEPRYSSGSVILNICRPEDIFLFKSVTEREGDQTDSENILKSNPINWNTLLEEIKFQMSLGTPSWITFTTERMVQCSKNFNVPILESVKELELEYLNQWADQFQRDHPYAK